MSLVARKKLVRIRNRFKLDWCIRGCEETRIRKAVEIFPMDRMESFGRMPHHDPE